MFQMYSKSLFVSHKILSFSLFWVCALLCGEPFLAPDDPFIRHEIRMLGDEGDILGIQNNWPLNLGALSGYTSDDRPNWGHSLLEDKIEAENNLGWSPITSTIGFSDNRVTSRGFGPEPRSNFASNVSVSWMNDRFAAKLSMNAFYGMEMDWKDRMDEGFALDGSYFSTRLGNWSATLGQVDRWWGPGWDGSLILSTNARPIPSISIERRIPDASEKKWLSWLGPWSLQTFVGRMEEERHIPHPYLWGMRGDLRPTILGGLEVGFFRMIQLGGDGRPDGFSTWVDALLSQDNYGANTGNNDRSKEPGNQLAGIDLRWKVMDAPIALYGQLVGEDEDKFLPNCLMLQYGFEGWKNIGDSTLRVFAEYADLTSYWWTGDPRTRNISYSHHIYKDGYRYRGRPIGHWADQDSQIVSVGGFLLKEDGVGWGGTLRTGVLNEDASGRSTVSDSSSTVYSSFDIFNSRQIPLHGLAVYASMGWESLELKGVQKNNGLSVFLSLTRIF